MPKGVPNKRYTGELKQYALAMLLEIPQLLRSTYYYHSKQQSKDDKYAHAKAEIAALSARIRIHGTLQVRADGIH